MDSLTVGKIVGAYGVKGWVKVRSFTEEPEAIFGYAPWVLRSASGVMTCDVVQVKAGPKGFLVQLDQIRDREAAAAAAGSLIEVGVDQLQALDEGEYYWRDLIGCRVSNTEGKDFGVVHKLLETGANDVLVVKGDRTAIDSRERLIPYLPGQVVLEIDLGRQHIEVDWEEDF